MLLYNVRIPYRGIPTVAELHYRLLFETEKGEKAIIDPAHCLHCMGCIAA
jgi:hypothetical protein